MSEKSISEKLSIKPGRKWLLVNCPDDLIDLFPLPTVQTTEKCDVLFLFITNREEWLSYLPVLDTMVNEGGAVWIAYPKLTSKQKSNINRDLINQDARQAGWVGVAMIAINETWSALRIRPQ
jgi:hypothetical protein